MTKLGGDLSLRGAGKLAEMLKQDLANHSEITVVFEAVTSIDITAVQILIAARKSAIAGGKTMRLQVPAEGLVPELFRRIGFIEADDTAIAPKGDFWITRHTNGEAA